MKKINAAFCLMALCAMTTLPAQVHSLVQNPDNDIRIDTKTGLATVRRLGGIKPQQPLVLGHDVFNTKQMEKKPVNLTFTPAEGKSGSFSGETKLNRQNAGLDLDGVLYAKSYSYNPEIPELKVTMTFSNASSKTRYAYWGLRNQFQQRPNVSEAAFLPRTIGTYPQGTWLHLQFYANLPAWTSTLAEPWCAKMDQDAKTGLAFLPDQDALSSLYTGKGKNVGLMFDKGYLPPGKTVTASCLIRPIKGLAHVTTVNHNLAAQLSSTANSMAITVFPYVDGLLTGTLSLVDKDRHTVVSQPVSLTLKHGQLASFKTPHPKMTNHSAVVFQGTINNQSFSTEQYCENGVRMQAIRATAFAPYFTRPALTKEAKVTVADSVLPKRKKEAVCLFGLFTPFNRFDRILKGWKIDNYSVWDVGMKELPPASTLDEKSVMIISNAFADGMEVCLPRVLSYVSKGGLLIVMGGPSAFGTGAYQKNTALSELLPVQGHAFDLQPVKGKDTFDQGLPLTGVGIAGQKPPHIYWNHQDAKLRPTAKVLWQAGNHPILIRDSYGKGTVLCFLAGPLGKPQDGTTPYWDSDEYVTAMRTVIDSILKEAGK